MAETQQTVIKCRSCGCTDLDCKGCIERTGQPCYWVEPDLCSACLPASRRVKFTFPQYRALHMAMRRTGIRESHQPELDLWQAQALYEAGQVLPHTTTREFLMRESILKKLEWARPAVKTKTLAEVL
jgi:hypothetical protein